MFRAAARQVSQAIERVGTYYPHASLLRKVKPYSLSSRPTLSTLKALVDLVNTRGVEGDVVECGTYKGGSAAVLATGLTAKRHLWLYDSFEGMPPVSDADGEDARQHVGDCLAREEDVIEVLGLVGVSSAQYTIRKGWFEETFKLPLPPKVALLHCDADWHDSVMAVLEAFYPLVSEGGCVILDDFGYWEGCRKAFYDFCLGHGEMPLLERSGLSQAYWFKGRANNRGSG